MDSSTKGQTERRTAKPAKRLPSVRTSALLAAAMLGIGVTAGAAIGPAPEASLAGSNDIVQKLPALLAAAAHGQTHAATPSPAPVAPPTVTPQATPASAKPTNTAVAPARSTTPASTTPSEAAPKQPATSKTGGGGASKIPPITSVWLIQLAGPSFAEALAAPTAAPYITGQLLPKATLLSGWSALEASALAGDAALVEHRATVGGAPPVLHTIVQPPCPEGAPGAACASGTGQLTAADEFLKATIATITNTTTYSEHGLVVVTFATVANPAASELPAGASSSTLSAQPPAGVALLSPFAKAGVKSTVTFNPTSVKQSLEALLH